MPREQADEKKIIRSHAKQAAKEDGKDWAALSQQEKRDYRKAERKAYRKAERKAVRQQSDRGPDPAREKAKSAAEQAGYAWRDLTKDQRKAYLDWARNN